MSLKLKLDMFTNVPFYTDLHDEAASAQESLDTKSEVEDAKPEFVKQEDKHYSRLNSGEDEWTNLSTIVPYKASVSPPANSWISKLVKTVDKLTRKYSVPVEKRKPRAYIRKVKTSPIVPKEFSSLYTHLAIPDSEPIIVPEPYPTIAWDKVRFKPSLPSPKHYPLYSCSPDPTFYEDKPSNSGFACDGPYNLFKYQDPFGTLPGYRTNLGVVDVPTTPVGGYIYCPGSGWVVYATTPDAGGRGEPACSSASGG
jgi:hypothetical protein